MVSVTFVDLLFRVLRGLWNVGGHAGEATGG
jgi:hypothetical protein